MERRRRDDPHRILKRSPEAVIASRPRRGRPKTQAADAGRLHKTGALTIGMQVLGACFGRFGLERLAARGLLPSDGQTRHERCVLQKTPARRWLRIHVSLLISVLNTLCGPAMRSKPFR